ncbi:MAG: PhzF family phenazine biosynthesis protein, partial [Mycobacteriales bacterium]
MRIYQVDSFSARPFGGNPAGVCPLAEPAPEAWMQRVAAEVNVSETAFTHPLPDGSFRLRWFTPTAEVDLCGHATLATAHIIATAAEYPGRKQRPVKGELLRFATNSGELTAAVDEKGITLDFPATPVQGCP